MSRVSGVFGGIKRHSARTTATAPTVFSAPSACDTTGGITDFGMDGNAVEGNCFDAAIAHALMCQATEALDLAGNPTYVAGFVPYDEATVVGWYHAYETAQGWSTVPPGEGTDITSGAAWFLANVEDIEAIGVIAGGPDGEFDANVIREAIFDFQGGAIVCWALDPDAQTEFTDHVCWGVQSAKPDAQEGHATTGALYDQSGITVVTWSQLQCTTDLVDANCIDGLVVIASKWLRAKMGDSYADQVIAKWALTTKEAT